MLHPLCSPVGSLSQFLLMQKKSGKDKRRVVIVLEDDSGLVLGPSVCKGAYGCSILCCMSLRQYRANIIDSPVCLSCMMSTSATGICSSTVSA